MRIKTSRYFACDFETTVYDNQERTDVWASCLCELGDHEPILHGNIYDTYEYFESLNSNIDAYYHNLSFDGNFWMYFLLHDLKFNQAYYETKDHQLMWYDLEDMPKGSFKYLISKMGQWYTLTIRLNNGCYLTLKDSLKLFPFKLEDVAKGFGTKHKKLSMEYKGFRYPNCYISPEEKEYIHNDVYVLKEALEIFFSDNPHKLTIGGCCLEKYYQLHKDEWEQFFPKLTEIQLPSNYKYPTAEAYIRRSYRGGWCYVVPEKANQIHTNGLTADVNSLYPSVMSGESDNQYPIGKPTFWQGNFIPEKATKPNIYFFVRIKTRFYIKDGYLPFIQVKNSLRYRSNDVLETSDYYDKKTKKYYPYIIENGEKVDTRVELIMTQTDYALFLEHYDTVDFEILDGCYFWTLKGDVLFDSYINPYKEQKMNSKGAKRTEAKLFLNNLYGKFATSDDSTFKVAEFIDGVVKYRDIVGNDKTVLYIPIGSAITSYARNFTIRTAQLNYYGKHKRGFIYADTDSIHCDLKPEELKGINVHPNNFLCWKLESYWDRAIFARQKTYIEHVTHNDGEPVPDPYYDIKCAGMPQQCKALLRHSLEHITEEQIQQLERERDKPFKPEERKFMLQPRELTDFKVGLTVPSKLIPKKIEGGVLLVETTYRMNESSLI